MKAGRFPPVIPALIPLSTLVTACTYLSTRNSDLCNRGNGNLENIHCLEIIAEYLKKDLRFAL